MLIQSYSITVILTVIHSHLYPYLLTLTGRVHTQLSLSQNSCSHSRILTHIGNHSSSYSRLLSFIGSHFHTHSTRTFRYTLTFILTPLTLIGAHPLAYSFIFTLIGAHLRSFSFPLTAVDTHIHRHSLRFILMYTHTHQHSLTFVLTSTHTHEYPLTFILCLLTQISTHSRSLSPTRTHWYSLTFIGLLTLTSTQSLLYSRQLTLIGSHSRS